MLTQAAIISELNAIEPNLSRLATTADRSDASTVEALTAHGEVRTRANAVTLISLIDPMTFWRVLPRTLKDPDVLVRLQSVRALENFTLAELEQHADLVELALKDADSGVRKYIARTAVNLSASSVRQALESMAASDPEQFVRDEISRSLRPNR
ncbi:HEAT repeat domain-containing protein [Bradyrhizobium sp. SZCCHNS3002]|uniref:HEAT repeat domain-containing protein n=1 Tax=Bradyrhizobium sp. SZCCHNS3002 TaxID=3057310 RepID=UPI0028F14D2B|nr:HEAT repeat domain-containing protein [Bradyrhizobium sp. SZCCHNS3002]